MIRLCDVREFLRIKWSNPKAKFFELEGWELVKLIREVKERENDRPAA